MLSYSLALLNIIGSQKNKLIHKLCTHVKGLSNVAANM